MNLYNVNSRVLASEKKALASIITSENEFLEIYEYEHSGKVITREKIDTLTKVNHPGIIIGKDKYQRVWVAHNHYLNKRPTFDLLASFSKGKMSEYDSRKTNFSQAEIAVRAISEVKRAKEYKALSYNCQTFVNLIVVGEQKSEAVDKIADGAMFLGGALSLIGLLTKSKGLTAAGATILGTGGVAKGISRYKK